MLLSIVAILVGLTILVWSADRFVDGAAAIAQHMGVSNLIIGITVVGFGTSAPEIAVSVIAVLEEVPGIAVGNAIGSNIANIGLILGITRANFYTEQSDSVRIFSVIRRHCRSRLVPL